MLLWCPPQCACSLGVFPSAPSPVWGTRRSCEPATRVPEVWILSPLLRHGGHTQTQNHTASPRSPVMESPKKKNQQLKVRILHLGSRPKKIRIQLRSQCVTWKVICKSCISQTPGINLDLGSGVKVKIIPKEEHCKMPEAGEEQPQV
ncbi:X antigen family member 1 isoform X1 [Pan paniscus]|uniref:X antigen family member 1 isoform X1 n=1 Tax=Pan paniscus TaxID=9597 RepID=UPI0000E25D3E|nr:X antigen family member 1 isoform X1 [Pan paniscus]XP_003805962.1 X antigen family member 1 isoform X1 [Pan paniscus]XP_054532341.1 X antigen family member 1 isoform X1 [Pan troglodytes]XP_054532343.1 X antigen family member 1 isoform X1 [Pan troglodytes]